MKRLFLTVSVCALCGALSAQEMYDALAEPQLSDNVTVEQEQQETPLLSTTVAGVPSSETSPYAIYAPSSRLTKEGKMKRSVEKGGHRGLDFGVDLDFIVQKGGAGSFGPDVTIGKRFNKSFYAGIVGGPQVPFQGGKTYGMVAADFKYFHPLANNEKLAPGGMFRIGYHGDFSDYSFVTLQIVPTFQYVASKKVDINLGIGFADYVFTGTGGGNSAAFLIKAGFDVHKPADHQKTILRHNNTVDSGVELTLGIDALPPGWGGTIDGAAMGGIVLAYKWNQNLSFGVGFTIGECDLNKKDGLTTIKTYTDGRTEEKKSKLEADDNNLTENLFLLGSYRILKGNHSPIVSCDLGLIFSGVEVWKLWDDEDDKTPTTTAVYFSPAVGYSFRTTSNSYLFAKVGYKVSSPILKSYEETTTGRNYDTTYKYDKVGASGLYFTVGYTHTFNWLRRKQKSK